MGTKLDIRYIAGIIDGEGTIGVYLQHKPKGMLSPNIGAVVAVGMTDCRVLDKLASQFGGRVKFCKHKNRSPRWKDYYRWQLCSRLARLFLERVTPHLQLKQKQAKLALKLLESQVKWKGGGRKLPDKVVESRLALIEQCHKLNKKGPLNATSL